MQRPGDKVQEVAVNVYDDSRPNVVLEVRFFDAESGSFLRLGIQR